VVKLPNGDYTSLDLKFQLDEAVSLANPFIRNAAALLRPDVVIVDEEPTGFRGELVPTLEEAKARGARLVLGIRDVMDEPALLVPEWERKGSVEALERFYRCLDLRSEGDVRAFDRSRSVGEVRQRMVYTGYLRRELPREPHLARYPKLTKGPFVLVTTGGGGDGDELIDWVISAFRPPATCPCRRCLCLARSSRAIDAEPFWSASIGCPMSMRSCSTPRSST
jgi:predicted glycosyltransferase